MKMPVFALLADGAALSGCASIKPAQMALPAPLVAAEPVTISGIGAGRSGSFGVGDGDEGGSFQRGRDFLSLFDVVSFDRAATRYEFQGAGGQPTKAACVGRQATLTLGIVTGQPTPYTLRCEWSGEHNAQMTLEAPSWMPGTKAERRGNFISGSLTLELRSVHQVHGSKLPLEAPIGYLITQAGQPVGAVDMNGTRPRLWRPAAGSALREPVTLAALEVALVWDPTAGTP